jgi:MFS family permease
VATQVIESTRLTPAIDPFQVGSRAVVLFAVVTAYAWLSFIFLPLLIDTYVASFHLSAKSAGVVGGSELGALTLAALISSVTVHKHDKRVLCSLGALIVIFGNLFSIATKSWELLGLSRLVVGAGLGMVVSATNALPALSERSERLYAYGQLALCVLGSLLIFSVPPIVARAGYQGIFYLEIAISAVAIVCSAGLPAGIVVRGRPSGVQLPVNAAVIRSLAGAALFYGVQTALWAFSGQAGAMVGLSADAIDNFIGASAIIGAGGALLAIALGTRAGLLWPLIIGFGSQAILGVLLYSAFGAASFAVAMMLITASCVFTTPYILAVAARLDNLGRVASATGAFMNFGAAFGPVLAGSAAARVGYGWMACGSAILLAGGLAIVLRPARLVDGAREAGAVGDD